MIDFSSESMPVDLWAHLRHFLLLVTLISTEFVVVYYGADWLTAHRTLRIHAYTSLESSIPLVPVMVVPYMTMYLVFAFSPFILRSRIEIDRFAFALAQVILIAGIVFLLLPAAPGFAPVHPVKSVWDPWLHWAAVLSRRYNLVPSLHIALFTTAAATYALRVSIAASVLLGVWLAIVAASTLFTHQHNLIDIVTGLALGVWGARAARISDARPSTMAVMHLVLRQKESECSL